MSEAEEQPSFLYTLRSPVHDLGRGATSPRIPFNSGLGWVSWPSHGDKASEDEAGLDLLFQTS
jgi:hypothetical protein